MKLYHCSNMDFDKIDLSKSKPNKDFGRAFYLSEHADEIKPVGKAKVLLHGGEFTMLEYEFDEKLLSDGTLRVLRLDAYTSDWAEFILLTEILSKISPITMMLSMGQLPMIMWENRFANSDL